MQVTVWLAEINGVIVRDCRIHSYEKSTEKLVTSLVGMHIRTFERIWDWTSSEFHKLVSSRRQCSSLPAVLTPTRDFVMEEMHWRS